jgi:hypothetical protein
MGVCITAENKEEDKESVTKMVMTGQEGGLGRERDMTKAYIYTHNTESIKS